VKILLVRLRLIGDVVFTTPLIGALRREYPAAHLTYVVEPAAAPVVEHHPDLDELIVLPRARGWRRVLEDVRFARRLRRMRFDLAIDLHGGPRSAWLTWASRAPRRVGYDVPGRSWMYTTTVHRSRALQRRHSVENQWDLLPANDPVFAGGPDAARDRVTMTVTAETRASLARRLQTLGVGPSARVIVLHVSAGNPFRRWPEAAFAETAAALAGAAADRVVIVTSGPSDREAASRVLAAARDREPGATERLIDGEGLSLAELRALMDRAALFIGGDSGPLHIAATSDVPIVGLYGPTLPARSAPWRPAGRATIAIEIDQLACRPCDQRVCVTHDYRCLVGLGPRAVWTAAERMLESAR
jgi:lipopolysaccharide heptosyltransferase II